MIDRICSICFVLLCVVLFIFSFYFLGTFLEMEENGAQDFGEIWHQRIQGAFGVSFVLPYKIVCLYLCHNREVSKQYNK